MCRENPEGGAPRSGPVIALAEALPVFSAVGNLNPLVSKCKRNVFRFKIT